MLFGIDRLKGCDQEANVEMQCISCVYRTLSGVVIGHDGLPLPGYANASLPVIEPGRRHIQGLVVVKIGIQGPLVVFVAQYILQSFVDGAHPNPFLVVFHIPMPIHALRSAFAFITKAHQIFSCLRPVRNRQCYIFYVNIFAGNQHQVIVQHPVILQSSPGCHLKRIRFVDCGPGCCAGVILLDGVRLGLPVRLPSICIRHDQVHRFGEDRLWCFRQVCYLFGKMRGDLLRKAVATKQDIATQYMECIVLVGDRQEGLDNEVRIGTKGRVQPPQPGHIGRIVIAVVGNGVSGNLQGQQTGVRLFRFRVKNE